MMAQPRARPGPQNRIWTEPRTAQIPVPGCIVLRPRNQARGLIFEPHPIKVEHQLVRHENPLHNRFILPHDLDLVLLERLRGIVHPVLSDWEPVTVTSSGGQATPKKPDGRRLYLQPLNIAVFSLEQRVITSPSIVINGGKVETDVSQCPLLNGHGRRKNASKGGSLVVDLGDQFVVWLALELIRIELDIVRLRTVIAEVWVAV